MESKLKKKDYELAQLRIQMKENLESHNTALQASEDRLFKSSTSIVKLQE